MPDMHPTSTAVEVLGNCAWCSRVWRAYRDGTQQLLLYHTTAEMQNSAMELDLATASSSSLTITHPNLYYHYETTAAAAK